MAYVGLGYAKKLSSRPGTKATMTPAQQADQVIGAQAITVCNQLSRAGMLVTVDGRPAYLGSPEHAACVQKSKAQLQTGATPQQVADSMVASMAERGSSKWLLYGGIAAVV